MFGYVRIDKPELRIREYEAYRAAYCGLCRSMGKCTGCLSRMTLSYDFAFLLIFRTVLTGEKPETELCRCLAHPTKKRPMMKYTPESEYVSAAAAILTYYKCLDDLADEKGKKRMRARALLGSAKRMRRRALRRRPDLMELDGRVANYMKEIAEKERVRVPSVDLYAGLSGDLLAEIFAFGLSSAEARIARTVGRHVGKWIYLVDAFDDLEEDKALGRFNPYLVLFGRDAEIPRETVRVALLSELSEVERAMDLVTLSDYPDYEGVFRNILYGGMPKTATAVLSEKPCCHGKKQEKRKGNG